MKAAFSTLCALTAAVTVCHGADLTTDEVLKRLDGAARTFRGMKATFAKKSYTAIIKETTAESGRITLRSPKPRQVTALIEIQKPEVRSIAMRDKKVQIFYPKINTVQEIDIGKYDSLLTQGLLIGFGTSASDLKKSYGIQYKGEEAIDGQRAFKLELLPRVESIKQHLSRIELWISESTNAPVQQRLHQSSGDYTQIQYSGMQLMSNLTEESVTLSLPKNVKREYPQK